MIAGIVRTREARIRLTVRGFRGRRQEIEAVVDSGYTGWLTLPPAVMVTSPVTVASADRPENSRLPASRAPMTAATPR